MIQSNFNNGGFTHSTVMIHWSFPTSPLPSYVNMQDTHMSTQVVIQVMLRLTMLFPNPTYSSGKPSSLHAGKSVGLNRDRMEGGGGEKSEGAVVEISREASVGWSSKGFKIRACVNLRQDCCTTLIARKLTLPSSLLLLP